jgi:hypothetical protein
LTEIAILGELLKQNENWPSFSPFASAKLFFLPATSRVHNLFRCGIGNYSNVLPELTLGQIISLWHPQARTDVPWR